MVMRLRRGTKVRAVERVVDAHEADVRVLAYLAELGCDPALPRQTRHYVYVPSRRDAEAAGAELELEGWRWSTTVDKHEGAWLVVAKRTSDLSPELVRETRRRLESLAERYGGLYDGWDAAAD
jgi:regulator of RNase E activity RraB